MTDPAKQVRCSRLPSKLPSLISPMVWTNRYEREGDERGELDNETETGRMSWTNDELPSRD